jgi:arylsulfatase A-like enzyme
MSKMTFCVPALLAIALAGLVEAAALRSEQNSGENPPNVLLILTDDQGYGDAAFQGNAHLHTPHLDDLAAEGVRFTNFLASPTCSPSRAALLTGRHEFRSGVTHTIEGRYLMREGVPTMADAFRAAGYRTAIFGKWHLGDTPSFHPLDRGFDHALLTGAGAVGQTPDYWGNTMFDPWLEEDREWKVFDGYATDVLVDRTIGWMKSNRQPWFVYLPLNAPHTPLQVGEEWWKPYHDQGLPENLARFYGMIENLDAAVGRLLEAVRSSGLQNRTLIVFLGDNGTSAAAGSPHGVYNGGLRGIKGSPYQGGVRVPAVFAWPGHFPAGTTIDTLAGLCDVFPTLAQACGLETSELPASDGRSLLPLLEQGGAAEDWGDRFLFTHVARWPMETSPDNLLFRFSSVRNQRYSLVNGEELYDLQVDPGESKDIAGERPSVRQELRQAQLNWWREVRDDALRRQPFVIGAPGNPVVDLNCMDWYPSISSGEPLPDKIWHQSVVQAWADGRAEQGVDGATGGWWVRVDQPGNYVLELRQLPPAAGEAGAFKPGEANLEVGGQTFRQSISAGERVVRLHVSLPAGEYFLEPVITGQRSEGRPQGAYFCRVSFDPKNE